MATPTLITISGTLEERFGVADATASITFIPRQIIRHSDGTVITPNAPYRTVTDADGAFTLQVPATDDPAWTPQGWTYTVVVDTGERKHSWPAAVPYDTPGGQMPLPMPAVSASAGQAYAPIGHTHPGGGGGGGSTAWADITGKPTTFPPVSHNHPISDITSLQAALNGKEASGAATAALAAHLAALDPHSQYLTQAEGDALYAPISEGGGGGGAAPVFVRQRITSGSFPNVEENTWTVVPGLSISVPAVAGDSVELAVFCLLDHAVSALNYYETVVLVAGAAVRFASTGTNAGSVEGDPALYTSNQRFTKVNGPLFNLAVQAGDLEGGNVTFGFAHKGPGSGRIFADSSYPFRWHAVNFGQ